MSIVGLQGSCRHKGASDLPHLAPRWPPLRLLHPFTACCSLACRTFDDLQPYAGTPVHTDEHIPYKVELDWMLRFMPPQRIDGRYGGLGLK